MRTPIETLAALGCDTLILTNSAGSLRTEVGPGEIMLITDHIAFSGRNPLIGEPTDDRFVGMTDAYDADLRAAILGGGRARRAWRWRPASTCGSPGLPSRRRPRSAMARILGADAVGMSTVPEVILGRFCGLRVAAISTITNFAAGMTGAELSHEETKMLAPIGAAKLERVIRRYLRRRFR